VGRSCTACAHPDRRKIDKAMVPRKMVRDDEGTVTDGL
jgi:hypothetical protein